MIKIEQHYKEPVFHWLNRNLFVTNHLSSITGHVAPNSDGYLALNFPRKLLYAFVESERYLENSTFHSFIVVDPQRIPQPLLPHHIYILAVQGYQTSVKMRYLALARTLT